MSVNTGWASLIPGSSVSVCPVLTHTMNAGHNLYDHLLTTVQQPNEVIRKVLLKATGKGSGKKASPFKTFTLRNIDSSKVDMCSQLTDDATHPALESRRVLAVVYPGLYVGGA